MYTRQEVVGDEALNTSTLRSLGLLQGKCLLRLMHKVPESLKVQANVYAIKEKERGDAPEKIHRPMRLEAATLPKKDEVEEESHKEEAMDLSSGNKAEEVGEKSKQVEEMDSLPVASTSTSNSLPPDAQHQQPSADIIKSNKRLIAGPKVPAKARISRQKCHLRQNSVNCDKCHNLHQNSTICIKTSQFA